MTQFYIALKILIWATTNYCNAASPDQSDIPSENTAEPTVQNLREQCGWLHEPGVPSQFLSPHNVLHYFRWISTCPFPPLPPFSLHTPKLTRRPSQPLRAAHDPPSFSVPAARWTWPLKWQPLFAWGACTEEEPSSFTTSTEMSPEIHSGLRVRLRYSFSPLNPLNW